ncbi:MAG: hypothetical protein LBP91_04285 [Coriobacteriales bacterium]|jgi:hypothetical protein|nr:hypothetical protein [Coriobacteriales bacterium]
MKKILVIALMLALSLTLLAACNGSNPSGNNSDSSNTSDTPAGTEDSSGNINTSGEMNPPSWLVGTWICDADGEVVKVTANNVVVSSGNLDFSWQIKNIGLKLEESTNGDAYAINYTASGIDFMYTFTSLTSDTMEMKITLGDLEAPAVYKKQ